jgi:hypothetical protein
MFSLIIVSYNFQSAVSNKHYQQSCYIFSTFFTFPVFFITETFLTSPTIPLVACRSCLKSELHAGKIEKEVKDGQEEKEIGKRGINWEGF